MPPPDELEEIERTPGRGSEGGRRAAVEAWQRAARPLAVRTLEPPALIQSEIDQALSAEAMSRLYAAAPVEPFFRGPLPEAYREEMQGMTPAKIASVRREIERFALEPRALIAQLLPHTRVLAMGDFHVSANPQRRLAASAMPALRQAGATHLAVEVPASKQPVLDRFADSGILEGGQLPEILQQGEFYRLLHAARQAGLKLVACDAETLAGRESQIARCVGRLLDEDARSRVVLWIGSKHLQDAPGDEPEPSAVEIIRRRHPVVTVLDQSDLHYTSPLARITRDIRRPAALNTREAREVGAMVALASSANPARLYRDWDYVIVYPAN